ncbi:MAG: hypothetical protein ACR2LK_14345 [Solirubrobacteraceae bacterium]
MSTVDDLAVMQNGSPDPISAAEQLAALLDLGSVGIDVRGARVYGRGRTARVEVDLSNGETMVFAEARLMMRPAELAAELVACTGATPKINGQKATRAFALVRALAEHSEIDTDNDVATAWGMDYLQAADVLDLDLNDQVERWAAFERLDHIEPLAIAREHGRSLAAAGLVLRHQDGSRLVRTGWFLGHVRQHETAIGQAEIARRMAAVGWSRRGQRGRIKATCPGRAAVRAWNFHLVPADWETR